MKMVGKRVWESASCELVISKALPPKMRPEIRELVRLGVPEADRKKGYASQLLHDVCREADGHDLTLLLSIEGDDKERLCNWYARYGFMPIQVRPLLMARMPGSTPRIVKPLVRAVHSYH